MKPDPEVMESDPKVVEPDPSDYSLTTFDGSLSADVQGNQGPAAYYVVDDLGVSSTPVASGVLLNQIQDQSTPDWVRELLGGALPK